MSEQGIDITCKSNFHKLVQQSNCMKLALDGRKENVVQHLFEKYNINVDKQYDFGRTALIIASVNCHESVVRFLVTHKADVNIQDKGGCTALIYAAMYGHENIVRCLFEHNADIEKQDRYGMTALMYASWKDYECIVRYLIRHGARLDKQDKHGLTALMYSAVHGENRSISRYLIKECGADVNIKDKNGFDVLELFQDESYFYDSNHVKYIIFLLSYSIEEKDPGILVSKYVVECKKKQKIITIFCDRFTLLDTCMLKIIFSFLYPELET